MGEPRSILAVQLRRIGDVILTTPALSALRRRYPGARLDFLVEKPSVECVAGLADEVLVYDPKAALRMIRAVRAREYDLVVDFMGNPRTAILTAFSGAALRAGPAHVFHRWAYNIKLPQSKETHYAAREKIRMLAPLGVPDEPAAVPLVPAFASEGRPENRVGFFPASRKVTRAYPARHWVTLGKLIREKYGCGITVFWGPGERELADTVAKEIGDGASISEETTSLRDLAHELSHCKLVVTNCAGPKHVAVAAGVPTLTIHSSSDPVAWTPASHLSVRRDELHCIGCRKNECPYALECLEGLEPMRVFLAAEKALS